MEIQPEEIRTFFEMKSFGDEKVSWEAFIDKCDEFGLSLRYFDRESASDERIKKLADLHQKCYPYDFEYEDSLAYIRRCVGYDSFHAFMLEKEGRAVAARWFDDGKPYPPKLASTVNEYRLGRGSNLVVYTVQVMTHPDYRRHGFAFGLGTLMKDFCDTAFKAPPLFLARIADNNVASLRLHRRLGFVTGVEGQPRKNGQPTHVEASPLIVAPGFDYSWSNSPPNQYENWEVMDFPDHPVRGFLGRVAVFYSQSPHETLSGRLTEPDPRNGTQDTTYKYCDNALISEKLNMWMSGGEYKSAAHQTVTFTDTVWRGTVKWDESNLVMLDASVPKYFVGPDLVPSLVFSGLYVAAKKAQEAGDDTLTMRMEDDELKALSRLIDRRYPFHLTDFVEVGDHSYTVDKEALKKGQRDGVTLYLRLGKLCSRLEKLSWIASARSLPSSTRAIYDFES